LTAVEAGRNSPHCSRRERGVHRRFALENRPSGPRAGPAPRAHRSSGPVTPLDSRSQKLQRLSL